MTGGVDAVAGEFDWFPSQPALEDRWSHASGWMLLSGERRHVSCVIPVRDNLEMLSRLLPQLSDLLTECGFPWEIVVVDAGSQGNVVRTFGRFAEIASLRLGVASGRVSRARALLTGLAAARGDAVLLLDVEMESSVWRIPEMIERWSDGAPVVSAFEGDPGSDHEGMGGALDTRDFGEAAGNLLLLDRSIAQRLADEA